MTEKFKSIASFIISNLPPSVTSCMLDTEIVAVERKQGAKSRILPFQVLSTMKKSELCEATRDDLRSCHDDTGLCIFVFDLVAFNGESLVDWKLQYRRDRLRQVLAPMITPGYFEFAKSSDISFSSPDGTEDMDGASSTIERFLNDAIGVGRCEGLMLKSLHSRYSSNESREKSGGMGGWRKLKKDYIDSLADSFDCVPIGAWRGTGRKNAWFSPFLLAVYNSVTGEFQSICRCMSGFSDAFYEEKYKFYSTRLIDKGKPR
jgi:DNA ligase-1